MCTSKERKKKANSETSYRKWLKGVDNHWFFGFEPKRRYTLFILLVPSVAVIGVYFSVYWGLVSATLVAAIIGAYFLLQASWCTRKSWELDELLSEKKTEEEIQSITRAVKVCTDYVSVNRNWGTIWLVAAGALISLVGMYYTICNATC